MRITRTAALSCLCVLGVVSAGCGGGESNTGPTPTATISGSVTAAGQGVAGAQVALSGGGGAQTTGSAGTYRFENLSPGSYTIGVTLPGGFRFPAGVPSQQTVTVAAGQTMTANFVAEPVNGQPATVDTVRLDPTSFTPANLTIARGRTVVWIAGSTGHTITPEGHSLWNNVVVNSLGEVLRVTFNNTGVFNYVCEPHRAFGMVGSVTVQ